MRHSRLIHRCVPQAAVIALAAVAACGDDLNDPQVLMCDEMQEISVEVPATVRYLVAADGAAVIQSVTYTTPGGDVTLTDPPDESPDELHFREDIVFDEPAEAILRVQGEVATGGQIGLTHDIAPLDPELPVVTGPIVLCGG